MRIGLVFIGCLLLTAVLPSVVQAQAIQIDVRDFPLKDALVHFGTQESIDVVFSERQVEGRTTTCRYEGNDVEAALGCLLADNHLRAERVRRRQYVLAGVPVDVAEASVHAPLPRGMLRGFVVDGMTGDVLPGAHVYLPDLQLGTTTNEAGYFAVPSLPRQAYGVRFSFIGYQPRDTLLTAGAASTSIRLTPTSLVSGEVVVEASPEDLLPVEPGVINVPVQALEKLPSFPGEPDLFQALQWLPGVRKTGELDGGLVIRGGAPDQNLYLLDGAPVYHPWHAFSLISTFQTETFKDIKLYQGSFPAEHGGRLSAVLDAEMRDGNLSSPRAIASIGVLSGRFIVESPVNKNISFMLSGRRSYLDQIIGTEHPVEEDGIRDTLRTGYYFYDLSGKVTLRSGFRHRLSFSYYTGRDVLDVRLPFEISTDISEWLKPADLYFEIDQKWGNRLVGIRYQYLYSRNFFVTTTAYRSSYRAREGVIIRPTAASSIVSDYNVRLRDYGVKVDVDYYPSVTHQIRTGVQVVRRRFRSMLDARVQRSPGAVDSLDQASRVGAYEVVGYLQDSWQPSPRWQIQPGVRLSVFSGGSYVRVGPRLGVRYAVDPRHLVLRGSGGIQVQYLQRVRDRFSVLYDMVSSRWIPTSKSVPPSTSMQVSAGAESYPFSGLTLAVDGYWRFSNQVLLPADEFQSKDGLEGPGIDVSTLLGQYTRGRARAYGIEASARLERGLWMIWLSYAGGRSRSRSPELGEARYRPSPFDVPRIFRGAIGRNGRHWSFSFSTEWRSGLPITVPVARYALGDPLADEPEQYVYRPNINNGRLPPYLRFDAVLGYRFRMLGARFQIQANVFNVTNRRNVIDRLYDPQEEGAVEVNNRHSLPVLPLLEIRMEL